VRERGVILALLLLTLAASLALQLHRLGEPEVTVWDESFHAIVARNLLKHPLKPTLLDQPWLPYDYADWHANHVWMHKPILPLWQIAASFSVLGVDRFALRLPSAILATASVLLTFLIGRRLADARAGIVAAAIQAASPAVVQLVRGRLFADHVDVSLLFWTELSVLFLLRAVESGRWRDVVVCGAAQGCAYLSKSWLALIVTGLSVVACLLAGPPALAGSMRFGTPRRGPEPPAADPPSSHRSPAHVEPAQAGGPGFRFCHVLGILGAALVTIAPWTIYAFVSYQREFLFEYGAWWHHLAGEWEDWGAPWQRVVFDYLPTLHQVFLVPAAFAALALVVPAVRERSFGLLFALAWVAGVFLPHLLAPTKTPTATLISMPALYVLAGALVSRALRGDPWPQAVLAGVVVASLVEPMSLRPPNRGYALEPGLASIAKKNPWIRVQSGIAASIAFVLYGAGLWFARAGGRERAWKHFRTFVLCASLLGAALLLARSGRDALKDVSRSEGGGYAEVGKYARSQLPANAVLLVAGDGPYDHQIVMFHADRTAYPVTEARDRAALAAAIRAEGGEPFLVTAFGAGYPLPGVAIVDEKSGVRRSIYRFP
jgi:4-amino-4-deoxy-L-arabinose transferase